MAAPEASFLVCTATALYAKGLAMAVAGGEGGGPDPATARGVQAAFDMACKEEGLASRILHNVPSKDSLAIAAAMLEGEICFREWAVAQDAANAMRTGRAGGGATSSAAGGATGLAKMLVRRSTHTHLHTTKIEPTLTGQTCTHTGLSASIVFTCVCLIYELITSFLSFFLSFFHS